MECRTLDRGFDYKWVYEAGLLAFEFLPTSVGSYYPAILRLTRLAHIVHGSIGL